MILISLKIIIYSLLTIITLFFLGSGLTLLITPKKLKEDSFWLAPWFSIFFLIFFLVIFGLMGFSVKQISPLLILSFLILNFVAFFVKKLSFKVNPLKEVVILIFIVFSILFNCRPLITGVKSLTAVSFGNNDIIAYAEVSDYLVDHSIRYSFKDKNANNMITSNYRWVSIIFSFFQNIFQLKGFQFTYLFQVILFSLTIPTIYILFKILHKDSILGLIGAMFLFTFNVNLLYILYHNFLGQIFFWGIEVFLLIYLFSYLSIQEINTNDSFKYNLIIGSVMSVLFFSYHEGAIFIIAPVALFFLIRLIKQTNIIFYIRNFIIIFFITGFTSFFSIINAIKIDFMQAFIGYPGAPIGWQLFRSKIPFANPYEALGFYSIHSFEPLPVVLSLIFSILVLVILIKGIWHSKEKLLLTSFLTVYVIFYYWTSISQHNFFSYNRALTYTLPLMIVLFTIGLINLLKSKIFKEIKGLIFLTLIFLVLYSAKKLSFRFNAEYLSVGKDYQSLSSIQNNNRFVNERIYLENNINTSIPYWNDIWIRYFLNLNKYPINIVSFKKNQKIFVPQDGLVLIHKNGKYINAPRVVLRNIIWENDFFELGRLCSSDSCLMDSKINLSEIYFGERSHEDSLLISGWSNSELSSRWSEGKISSLRLFVKDDVRSKIVTEVLTLMDPQKMEILIDNKSIGSLYLTKEFKKFEIDFEKPLTEGSHLITFKFSNTYKPSLTSQSSDNRDLSANFKQIKLK